MHLEDTPWGYRKDKYRVCRNTCDICKGLSGERRHNPNGK